MLAVVRRGDDLLVYRAHDESTGQIVYRPLGGGIDFGELAVDALHRELREELGTGLANVRPLGNLESVFEWEGRPKHEISFVFSADLTDRSLYERDELGTILDGDSEVFWMPLSLLLAPDSPTPLVPPRLRDLLS